MEQDSSVDTVDCLPKTTGIEAVVNTGYGMTMQEVASQLSVLFSDVSGSSRLLEKLGHAEAMRAVDRCLRRMERAVEGFGGRVVKTVGDEMMSVFGSADEAAQAAFEIQQRLADLPPVSGIKLAVRMGLSHGTVAENDGEHVGRPVDVAALLAGFAQPGQVLIDALSCRFLTSSVAVSARDLGMIGASAASPGEHAFELLAEAPVGNPSADEAAALGAATEGDGATGARLPRFCLRYAGQVLVLDERRPSVSMGRAPECDLLIRDRRASRHHVLLELRGSDLVLSDRSTNGTYVTLTGQPETFLRQSEMIFRGRGTICFAASAKNPGADCAEIEPL